LDGAVQVIPAAHEHLVGFFADLHVQITGGSSARPDLSLGGEFHPRAVVDARGDVHRHRPARADPAFAGAFGARIAQEGAVPAAVGAGGGGHDVAEEGAGDPLHAAPALTGGAGGRVGARAGAGTLADLAQHGGVDLDVLGDAEGDLVEGEGQAYERVLAPAGTRGGPAGGAPPAAAAKKSNMSEKPNPAP